MAKNIQVKPGKAGSVLGLIVGCIFVGIGLFVVIPTFGPFGIFWTLGAGAIAVVNGINVFSQKGVATHTIVVEDDFPQGNASIHSPEERLRRWRICTKRDWSLGRSTTNPASGFWRSYKKYQRGFPRFPPPAVEKGREMELPLDETKTPGGQHWCCPPGVSLVCTPVL